MKHLTLCCAAALALAATFASHAATVKVVNGDVSFAEDTPWGKVDIKFYRCMANNLYTFGSVSIDGKELNHTESDNIGPFLIDNRGWAGGNHLNGDRRSAETVSVTLRLDGMTLDSDTEAEGKVLKVEVRNRLFEPVDDSHLADETIVYTVSGNSIDVNAYHAFAPEAGVIDIERYYGMQSMFLNEMELLTPGGAFDIWTSIVKGHGDSNKMSFTKAEAKDFCTFIEHSTNGYQATYMEPVDLGKRDLIRPDDIVFIGNSWTKTYHKVIGLQKLEPGTKTHWHGIYSWFREPVSDNSRPGAEFPSFDYGGYINGRPHIFHLGPTGAMTTYPL